MTDKNALASPFPFVYLMETTLGSYTIRLCNYTSDILFDGKTFTATTMQVGARQSSLDEKVTRLTITLANVTLLAGALFDDVLGNTGNTLDLYLVWYNGSNWVEVAHDKFTILTAHVTSTTLTIEIGIPNPLNTLFPKRIFVARTCPWRFKSPQCGYTGTDTSCNHTLEDCVNKFGSTAALPFGGFPGLSGGFMVVRW